MIFGIDASGITSGGGLTHLRGLIQGWERSRSPEDQVVVWVNTKIAKTLGSTAWLNVISVVEFDTGVTGRIIWQWKKSCREYRAKGISVLIVLSGIYFGQFRPFIAVSQNLLPFEPLERARYGLSWIRLRLHLIRYAQAHSFERASGIIFLTRYARDVVVRELAELDRPSVVIPHGLSEEFKVPRIPSLPDVDGNEESFVITYVSAIDEYKWQWNVVEAVCRIRDQGHKIKLVLIGPVYGQSGKKLTNAMRRFDPAGKTVKYIGEIRHENLVAHYGETSAFVFASSCETFGLILLEAMGMGLPICCSNRSAMPEILGDAGAYFDPEDPGDIAACIERVMKDGNLRAMLGRRASEMAATYLWEKCATATREFAFKAAGGSFGLCNK